MSKVLIASAGARPAVSVSNAPPSNGSDQAFSPTSICMPGPSKQWVLPPRAKPGRKPITDQPPTRRKAQNRAAQRAFRERRAARVGELEEELRQKETAFETERLELQASFENERQFLHRNVAQWRERAGHWEQQAQISYDEVMSLRRHLDQLTFDSQSCVSSATNLSSLPTPTSSLDRILPPRLSPAPTTEPCTAANASQQDLPSPQDCRNCGANGRCPCIEKVLNGFPEEPDQVEVNAFSASPAHETDRPSYEELETDFTARFAKKAAAKDSIMSDADTATDEAPTLSTSGHCGFCTDETNCICSQNAMDVSTEHYEQPATQRIPSLTSPPAASEVKSRDKRHVMEPAVQLTGPGTCPSCLANPDQRRFCQQLAGILPPPPLLEKDASLSKNVLEFPFPHEVSLNREHNKESVSCADAYSKLRQNPNFDTTKSDFGLLTGIKGHTADRNAKCNSCNKIGCSAFEVDCASILTAMRTSGKNYSNNGETENEERRP